MQPDVDAQGQTFQPRCHVYAYCLMGNYVHLLLKEGSSQVSQVFIPYSIVQRAASDAVCYGNMVCEPLPGDEEFETYIDDSEYEKYPEY